MSRNYLIEIILVFVIYINNSVNCQLELPKDNPDVLLFAQLGWDNFSSVYGNFYSRSLDYVSSRLGLDSVEPCQVDRFVDTRLLKTEIFKAQVKIVDDERQYMICTKYETRADVHCELYGGTYDTWTNVEYKCIFLVRTAHKDLITNECFIDTYANDEISKYNEAFTRLNSTFYTN